MFTIEANDELEKYINSKANYIDFGGENIKQSGKEAIQSLYNLTKVIDKSKLSEAVF